MSRHFKPLHLPFNYRSLFPSLPRGLIPPRLIFPKLYFTPALPECLDETLKCIQHRYFRLCHENIVKEVAKFLYYCTYLPPLPLPLLHLPTSSSASVSLSITKLARPFVLHEHITGLQWIRYLDKNPTFVSVSQFCVVVKQGRKNHAWTSG